MRLTHESRKNFINMVMADVPEIDYEQQMRDLVLAHFVSVLPDNVRRIWDDTRTRGYINTAMAHLDGIRYSYEVPTCEDRWSFFPDIPDDLRKKLEEIQEADRDQDEKRSELREKVRQVAYQVNTTDALLRELPEFEKYLPREAKVNRSVPAIHNLVKDLVEAGWPDGGKPQAA